MKMFFINLYRKYKNGRFSLAVSLKYDKIMNRGTQDLRSCSIYHMTQGSQGQNGQPAWLPGPGDPPVIIRASDDGKREREGQALCTIY